MFPSRFKAHRERERGVSRARRLISYPEETQADLSNSQAFDEQSADGSLLDGR